MRYLTTIPVAAAALFALIGPANAQQVPPDGAMPLTEVIAAVEKANQVNSFREVEWDEDGYWDIEFIDPENRAVSVRVDPMTGGPWTRKP